MNIHTKSDFITYLGVVLVFLFPLTTAVYKLIPIDLFGKNIFLFLVYLGAFTIICQRLPLLLRFRTAKWCLFFMLASIIMVIIRTIVFDQSLNEVFENRIIVSAPLFTLLAFAVGFEQRKSHMWAMMSSILIVAVLAFIRNLYFPTLFIGEGVERGAIYFLEYGTTTRETSIIGSPNNYGMLMCMGLFLLITHAFVPRERVLLNYILFVFLFASVFLSQSRAPGVVAVFLAMYFFRTQIRRTWGPLFLVLIILVVVYVVQSDFSATIDRLIRSDGVRDIKTQISLELLFRSFSGVLIGHSFGDLTAVSWGVVTISDNSLFAVALAGGHFLAIGEIWLIAKLIIQSSFKYLLGLIAGSFLLYNAIYWDFYVFYFFLICVWFSKSNYLQMLPQKSKFPKGFSESYNVVASNR